MAKSSIIEDIRKDKLCLGCGLCESICGSERVSMQLQSNGFFEPVVKGSIGAKEEALVAGTCPGLNVVNDLVFDKEEQLWGRMKKLYSGYSTDQVIRKQGSSGGIISAVAVYVLENKIVDAVLQVGGDSNDYERNMLRVSRNKADVLACASSRYAPALVFDRILQLLDASSETYCFIGKPCDISAMKNMLTAYPQYKERIKLTVSIMCAGMPSFNGTKAIIDEFKAPLPVKDLVYRGNGWPGFFSFRDQQDQVHQKSYNDSWGKTLNKHLNFRCKICPDGIGLQADIAVGDAWETEDGYPDFTEREGQSLVIVRTDRAVQLLEQAAADRQMVFAPLATDKIAMMQPYQYNRRKRVGVRVLAYYLGRRRRVNYKNLRLWDNMKGESPKALIKEFIGTFKRVIKF